MFAIFFYFCQMLLDVIIFCPNVAGILPSRAESLFEFKIPTHPDASGRIRDASGIGTSSAEICIWPLDRLLASSCARPAGRSPRHHRRHTRLRKVRNLGCSFLEVRLDGGRLEVWGGVIFRQPSYPPFFPSASSKICHIFLKISEHFPT